MVTGAITKRFLMVTLPMENGLLSAGNFSGMRVSSPWVTRGRAFVHCLGK